MLLGIVGSPSTGKSTFFSAATLIDVAIADYPFTTIEPNRGVTYVRSPCPCKELGVACKPKNSKCENGIRLIPTELLDVAGLVPGAHEGRGLGNRFLDDLRTADVLIQTIDASGRIDAEGKRTEKFDPAQMVDFLEKELDFWIAGILKRGWTKLKRGDDKTLTEFLSGLNITHAQVVEAATRCKLGLEKIDWNNEEIFRFASELRKASKPILIAANKIDVEGSEENFKLLCKRFGERVFPCYADGELALRRASEKGLIKYVPGDSDFQIINANEKQGQALDKIREVMKKHCGTGVQKIIDKTVLGREVVVYPVEDEHRYSDHFGNVLPHAFLMPKESTAQDLAAKIHTDLAKNFVCAIDARKKMRVGKEHKLQNGDVLKIVSGK